MIAVVGTTLALSASVVSHAETPDRGIGGLVARIPAAEPRTALVIGNSAYRVGPLKNPVNDAKAIGTALRECGFEVIEALDCTHKEMAGAIDAYGTKIMRGGVALFFYAGHGIQVDGENYLVPIDADMTAENEVRFACENAGRVLAKMENAGTRVNVVILDACRNNPFARSFRSAAQGLAVMNAAQGSIVAYSTAPGTVASDGSGENSVYTERLLKFIRAPGLDILKVFQRVGAEVIETTNGQQQPWTNFSLTSDFYFVPAAEIQEPAHAGAGRLLVHVNIPDVTVYLDGQMRGTASPSQPLLCGDIAADTVTVRVSAPGYQDQERRIPVPKGRETVAFLELESEAAAPPNDKATNAAIPSGKTQVAKLEPAAMPNIARKSSLVPEMVAVPGGTFLMGDPEAEDAGPEEQAHEVSLSSFYIAKYEVTAEQICAFLNDIGTAARRYVATDGRSVITESGGVFQPKAGCANLPANCVNWFGALEYTKWLSKREGKTYRLPTEAEWEYAARGATGRRYPWSSRPPEPGLANFDKEWTAPQTTLAPVDSMPEGATPDTGVFHLAGNVREWCLDYYDRDFYTRSPKQDPKKIQGSTNLRVVRGGSFDTSAAGLISSRRSYQSKERTDPDIGFRVVLEPASK